jgi:ribonuclease BN (tRNA processing enzyme)
VKVTLWGSRGSLPSPGPDTIRYGGNTSCVSVQGSHGSLLVLDAGTGIRCLGQNLPQDLTRVDILLTHLHMDHIQGLPFFAPLRRRGTEVHIVGPASTTLSLRTRLMRYLSPPLFPVNLRELDADLYFHEVPSGQLEIGEFSVSAQLVIHYNPTVGYRIQESGATVTFLPDHEPALGSREFPDSRQWTSGYDLAEGADLLLHDAQYTDQEYRARVGFGHSTIGQALAFADLAGVKHLVTFHHDPDHSDDMLDQMTEQKIAELQPAFMVTPGREEMVFEIGSRAKDSF